MTKHNLTFDQLRQANIERLPQFKNAKGEPAHDKADGSDWSLNDWITALAGEVGELANIAKKIRRGDMSFVEAVSSVRDEIADVACYLDLVALRAGIDLGAAVIHK